MNRILALFTPSIFAHDITDIGEYISDSKIKILLLDIDNTLVPFKSNEIEKSTLLWLKSIAKKKRIVLITNNSKKRVNFINALKPYKCVCRAHKPLPFCYLNVLRELHSETTEAVIVGDQIFDDILGGNLAGISTILVKPLKKSENSESE